MATKIQLRGDTSANWTSANPVISDREMILVTDLNSFKIGDGVKTYSQLPLMDNGYGATNDATLATIQANTARDAANAAANAGGSPKDSYLTLAALQAAFPTGTTGIYLVTANGHWYSWKGGAWTDGGVYLGALPVQTTGQDTTVPMSQKATTDKFDMLETKTADINENNNDGFFVVDKNLNVVFKINIDGTAEFIEKNAQFLSKLNGSDTIVSLTKKTLSINEKLDTNLDNEFYICDSLGNVAFSVNSLGFTNFIETNAQFLSKLKQTDVYAFLGDLAMKVESPDDTLYITDEKGNVILKANKDGVDFVGKSSQSGGGTLALPDPILPADINLSFTYGQSLSVIGTSVVPLDCTPSLQLKNGISIDYTLAQSTDQSFVDNFYGTAFLPCASTGYEGTGKRFMKQFMNLLKDENGLDIQNLGYKLLYATPGISGASISGLQSGSIGYTRIIQATTAAKRISDSINKTFSVPTLFWMQGESNYNDTQLAYYTALNTLFTNLNTDIKAITGQQLDVQFIVYQPATYMGDWKTANPSANEGVSMAMLQLVKDKLNVHFGCAMYQFDYGSDLLHVQGNGYLMMGAMAGIQAKRVMCDNNPLLAILPKSWVVTSKSSGGYLLEITFDVPVKPLIFDISGTTYCNVKGAQPNMGFSILNGSSIEIINSVAISRQNKVIISCTENPTGLELNYAKTGKYGGGNLRDSQGESIQISIGGISTKVHNWTPIFKQII